MVSDGFVVVSGRLTRSDGTGVANAPVTLVRSHAVRRGTTTLVTTDANGFYAVRLKLQYTTTFVAKYAETATGADGAAISAGRTVKVAPRILVSAPVSGSTSSASKALTVTGSVSPNKRFQKISLYLVRSDGSQKLLKTVTIGAFSKYRFDQALGRGTYTLIVKMGATPDNTAGASPKFKVFRK